MSKILKRIIIDVVVGLICITIITGLLLYAKSRNKTTEYDENNDSYSIVFRLYDEKGDMKINDTLKFTSGESVYNILNRNYDLKCKENAIGKAVLAVNEYETDFVNCYFAFYIKNETDEEMKYSNLGVESVEALDKMEIELRWTGIN